jgi:hypothetical protein
LREGWFGAEIPNELGSGRAGGALRRRTSIEVPVLIDGAVQIFDRL